MQKQRVKTSMSVPEMGKMLGLGKVESYWLVKKNYFKTIQVAGRMRVMLDSFEDWYAGQFHYKKVDGTPPGEKWRHELMDLFGDEYIDNNLVFCSSNGRPMESQVINRAFNKLIKENGLPHVVFHSLRHSSITYKLKLNGGDMKSVQGDSGHAQVKMVADVYSHIIDEDRCINAQRLEEAFYSSKTPDPVEDTEPKTADTAVTESDESDAAKILELLKNPETAALLKQLAKAL